MKNIKDGYATPEKTGKKIKPDLSEIVKGKWEYKSEEQKNQ